MIDVNLTSAFLCCRAVLPRMLERNRGRIVLASSRSADTDRSGQAAYAVSKAGVEVLARTIAEENKGSDVTANLVAPSVVDTPANRKAMPGADFSKWVLPEQIAEVCRWSEPPSGTTP
jgi:NAD(P)-dependent dehydrogenase (short-subunit alcohol dehydrogenase family)